MARKNNLFYALATSAVFSVATFGVVGIAAITGHLRVGDAEVDRLFVADPRPLSHAYVAIPLERQARPLHVGLTRQPDEASPAASRAFALRLGERIAEPTCAICGVVNSIERGSVSRSRSAQGRDIDGFVITVKMQDGTVRKIHELERPRYSVGQRVRFVNGSIVTLG
ncbi:MAG TPA: hypothetical protein VNM24_02860 [Burkholderiales bacterium]|nr:hypothetical protein [Burkholderiales bacterium]